MAQEEADYEREQREQWGGVRQAAEAAEGGWEGWSSVAPTAAVLAPDFRAAMLGQLRVLVIAFDNLAETQRRKVASGATDLVRTVARTDSMLTRELIRGPTCGPTCDPTLLLEP